MASNIPEDVKNQATEATDKMTNDPSIEMGDLDPTELFDIEDPSHRDFRTPELDKEYYAGSRRDRGGPINSF